MKSVHLSERAVLVILRWLTIVIILAFVYRLIPEETSAATVQRLQAVVAFYVLLNIFVSLLPHRVLERPTTRLIVFLADVLLVSAAIYLTQGFQSDLYLSYFLIILIAAVSRGLKESILMGTIACALYAFMLYRSGELLTDPSLVVRIPFLLITSLFASSFAQREVDLRQRTTSEINRLMQALEHVPEGMIVSDTAGQVVFANAAALSLLGLPGMGAARCSMEELIGRSHTPDVVKKNASFLRKAEEREIQLFKPDGTEQTLYFKTSVIPESGRAAGYLNIIHDITHKKRMEFQMANTQRLAAVGHLASEIAHELNNPLTSVLGFVQVMQKSAELPEEFKADLQIVHDQTQRCRKIIRSLLSYYENQELEIKSIPVTSLIESALERVQAGFEKLGMTIVRDFFEPMPVLRGDPLRLQQVLYNIVVNARDCMAGKKDGCLIVRARQVLGKVEISFQDNGGGIPPDDLGKIFSPYFTTKAAGKGMGWGLALSYRTVQEHGGDIRVVSQVGIGTVFTVELPFKEKK